MRRQEMCLLLGVLLAAFLGEAGAVTCFAGNNSFPLCTTCSGQCVDTVGCYCTEDAIIPCLPTFACNPDTTQCCPDNFFWFTNVTCCSEVLNCEPACSDDEVCTSQAGYAVCECNPATYLHANRSDITATSECESSAMTVSFSKCLLQRFKYNMSDMYTSDTTCTVTTYEDVIENKSVVKAQVLTLNGWCGNQMTINSNDKKVTYSNALYVPPDTSDGLVISNTLRVNFSCTYNLTMQTSLQTVLYPNIGTVTLPSVNNSGDITATMAAYMSNSFTDPYSVGDTLTVGNPLYIGISTTFTDADKFTLRADKCVASPNNSPSQGGVVLISSGCPVTDDVDVQILHNGDSLEVMFQIETFAFQDQSEVYMSCDVSLCPITTPNTCKCSSARLAVRDTVTIQMSPIGVSASFDISSGSHTDVSLWALLGSSLLALLSLRMI